MTERTALLIGATGLVGAQLVSQLLDDDDYAHVLTFARRPVGISHPKLVHHVVDFDKPESWSSLLRGDVLFSAMGTTKKTAGGEKAQWKVDYDYQLSAAKAAREGGARHLVLVSSTGADAESSMFYLRMKGKLEEAVLELGYPHTAIMRPSLLDGDRSERRPSEEWGLRVARLLPEWDALARLRPVPVALVARAARQAARSEKREVIWEAKDIFRCET